MSRVISRCGSKEIPEEETFNINNRSNSNVKTPINEICIEEIN